MQTVNKAIVKKLNFPVDGYLYDVQILTSVDGGKNFYFCGNGKYFKTLEEAEEYRRNF